MGGTGLNLTNFVPDLQHSFLGNPNKPVQDKFSLASIRKIHILMLFR